MRPILVELASCGEQTNVFEAKILASSYLGDYMEYILGLGEYQTRLRTSTGIRLQPGEKVRKTSERASQ
ncbi:MAG: hypothetical protein LM585_04370 [Fervidicoccaceae archaeon]|nr:hypothetical protein [Thermofilum sp.]MCC6052452.1 hypothetical protein [Fervidicoccaceae archaeon]